MTLFLVAVLANSIILTGYWVKNILWLRLFLIGGSVVLLPYFYFGNEPLWVPIVWNIAFIVVHSIRVREIIKDRQPVDFTQEENTLYLNVFENLTPEQFKKILKIGRWRDLGPGHQIQTESNPAVTQFAILYGAVEARTKNRLLGEYGPGDFIGIGCIARNPTEFCDTTVTQPTRILCWRHSELMQLLENDRHLRLALRDKAGASLASTLILAVERENR